ANALWGALVLLWVVCAAEAIVGVLRRDRTKPLRPVLLRAAIVCLLPPVRIGQPARSGLVWLPWLGWNELGEKLGKRVEIAFAGPILVFAVLILLLLALELL